MVRSGPESVRCAGECGMWTFGLGHGLRPGFGFGYLGMAVTCAQCVSGQWAPELRSPGDVFAFRRARRQRHPAGPQRFALSARCASTQLTESRSNI